MTVPQYIVRSSIIVGRNGNRQSTVDIPPHGIFVDVAPCCLVSLFAANDVVIEGFLPDGPSRHGAVQMLADGCLVLTEDDRQVLPGVGRGVTQNDDGVDMIGHHYIFVNDGVGEMLGNMQKQLGGNLTETVQLLHGSEDALLLMGADGDEIVIRQGIVVLGDTICFAFRMMHDDTSLRIRRSEFVICRWFCGTVITVPYSCVALYLSLAPSLKAWPTVSPRTT